MPSRTILLGDQASVDERPKADLHIFQNPFDGLTRELLARCWRNKMDAANPSTAQTMEACPRTIESFPSPELEETMLEGRRTGFQQMRRKVPNLDRTLGREAGIVETPV